MYLGFLPQLQELREIDKTRNQFYTKGRIAVDVVVVQQRVVAAVNGVLSPLDEHVAMRIPTGLNMHDALLVATALVYRDMLHEPVAVITKHGAMTRSQLIHTVW